jgi:hypothetical protein
MRKQILALIDPDEDYAARFIGYVNRRGMIPYEARAFTSLQEYEEFRKTDEAEILLTADCIQTDLSSPERGVMARLTEGAEDLQADPPRISRYQSCSGILRAAMCLSGETAMPEAGACAKPVSKVIGVFSPVSRCGKTAFAMAIGQMMARSVPTLYLNFELNSGLPLLFHQQYSRGLSDGIYYIRSGSARIAEKLLEAQVPIGEMMMLPPFEHTEELFEVKAEEWHRLLACLKEEASFERFVLDLGSLPFHCPELLDECDLIYMPLLSDPVSEAKVRSYETRLKQIGNAGILSRLRPVRLENHGFPESKDRWFELLPYSPFGKKAEEYLAAEDLQQGM